MTQVIWHSSAPAATLLTWLNPAKPIIGDDESLLDGALSELVLRGGFRIDSVTPADEDPVLILSSQPLTAPAPTAVLLVADAIGTFDHQPLNDVLAGALGRHPNLAAAVRRAAEQELIDAGLAAHATRKRFGLVSQTFLAATASAASWQQRIDDAQNRLVDVGVGDGTITVQELEGYGAILAGIPGGLELAALGARERPQATGGFSPLSGIAVALGDRLPTRMAPGTPLSGNEISDALAEILFGFEFPLTGSGGTGADPIGGVLDGLSQL